jgi:hypothetical protein
VFKKNISDGVGSRNGSIDAPLNPPLFWLDNIFKFKTFSLHLLFSLEEYGNCFLNDTNKYVASLGIEFGSRIRCKPFLEMQNADTFTTMVPVKTWFPSSGSFAYLLYIYKKREMVQIWSLFPMNSVFLEAVPLEIDKQD